MTTTTNNSNDLERAAISSMLKNRVSEKLIKAFSWVRADMVMERLTSIAKSHSEGKPGIFDMSEKVRHIEKAITGLNNQGYICTIRETVIRGLPRIFLIIEPPTCEHILNSKIDSK